MKKRVSFMLLSCLCLSCVFVLGINIMSVKANRINSLMEKSIYFDGKYYNKKSGDKLRLSQFSSYDSGNWVGEFSIVAWGGKMRPDGKLIRIGKNKYRYKFSSNDFFKGSKLIFCVKKKSVVVKQSGKKLYYRGDLVDFSGVYKLKKRFYH